MADLRDKLRETPSQRPLKGATKARPTKKSVKKSSAKASASLFQGLDVNRRLLFASIGIAVLAALIAVTYLSDAKSNAMSGWAKVKVYVASHDLPARKQIDESMISELEVPKALLPEGAYTDRKDVIGKISLAPLVKNEILHKVRVVDASQDTGVAPKLLAGERGFMFAPENTQEIAQLRPEDYIDLTATIPTANRFISTKVLQRVHVLSVGNRYTEAPPSPGADAVNNSYGDMLTLAVPTDKVALLTALKQQHYLSISLREPGDTSINPPEVSEADVRRLVIDRVPLPVTVRPVVVHDPAPVVRPVHVQPAPVRPRPQPAATPRRGPIIDIYNGTQKVH